MKFYVMLPVSLALLGGTATHTWSMKENVRQIRDTTLKAKLKRSNWEVCSPLLDIYSPSSPIRFTVQASKDYAPKLILTNGRGRYRKHSYSTRTSSKGVKQKKDNEKEKELRALEKLEKRITRYTGQGDKGKKNLLKFYEKNGLTDLKNASSGEYRDIVVFELKNLLLPMGTGMYGEEIAKKAYAIMKELISLVDAPERESYVEFRKAFAEFVFVLPPDVIHPEERYEQYRTALKALFEAKNDSVARAMLRQFALSYLREGALIGREFDLPNLDDPGMDFGQFWAILDALKLSTEAPITDQAKEIFTETELTEMKPKVLKGELKEDEVKGKFEEMGPKIMPFSEEMLEE